MQKLTRIEEACLEVILRDRKRQAEEYLEKHGDSFEAYFVKNETIPMIENLLNKIEIS
jgi:hypothetical protein